MIEVTCAACGSTQRFSETDGGKVASCAKCKARITVPRNLPAIPSPGSGGGTGDIINLSDLPAPKRPSPLAGAPARPPPAPPTIKGVPSPGKPTTSSLSPMDMPGLDMPALDMDAVDLPAPVGPTSRGLIDLPAPVGPTATRGLMDLPAPVGPSPTRGLMDLPAPVGPSPTRGLTDLPAPVGPSPRGATPRASSPALRQGSLDPFGDLPAPKRGGGAAFDDGLDLVAPKRPGPAIDDGIDLVAPKRDSGDGGLDLPAPKGFFDDLPAPAGAKPRGISDLPAPRGAVPSSVDLPAPKGPTSSSVDLPAPKGFFDDLPSPATAKPATADGLAPKGFFDDLPGPRTSTAPPRSGSPTGGPRPRGMDLDDLDLAPPTQPPQARTGGMPPSGAAGAVTQMVANPGVPALELEAPDKYGSLDLPMISPAGTDPAKAAAAAAAASTVVAFRPGGGQPDHVQIHVPKPDSLDLDIEDTKRGQQKPRATVADKPKDPATDAPVVDTKRRRMILIAVAAVVLIGGAAGFFFYQRWQKQQARTERAEKSLAAARTALADGTPKHWSKAADAAEAVLAVDASNDEALGIAVQGYVAGLLEDGGNEKTRRASADTKIDRINAISATGPQVEKGVALYAVINNDVDGAIAQLAPMAEKSKDPDVHLFLGWAYFERREWDLSIAAFSTAADAKNRAVPATYGMAQAQLAKGDLEAARASFGTVNDLAKKAHLGAQVGIAAAMPTAQYARRESELLSILNLKEIAKADPRVVALAWTLAGDDARRSGRLDAARDRYRKALELRPTLVGAIIGDAEVSLRENKLQPAEESLTEALSLDPDNIDGNLARADLYVQQKNFADAALVIAKLKTLTLPYASQRVRMNMLDGKRLELSNQGDAAVASYAAAQEVAESGDIGPAVAQATLLGTLGANARKAGQVVEADAYVKRSVDLLTELENKAKDDPESQLALGRAFLAAGNGAKAEEYLRKALVTREQDIEAHFQLVEALQLQGKLAEAAAEGITAFELDPKRTDIALKLAVTLEQAGRIAEAAKFYDELLDDPAVTLDTRIRAGFFYVHNGEMTKAGVQGDAVSRLEPKNAAGLYLRGEALYANAKYDEARKLFAEATKIDSGDAVYQEALGRACWFTATTTSTPSLKDDALIAWQAAARIDPTMLAAQLGRAKLLNERGEFQAAVEAYQAALVLAPDNPEIPHGIGWAYWKLGQPSKAIPWLDKAMLLKPNADAAYLLGVLYAEVPDPKKAAKAYAQATKLGIEDERNGKPTVVWLTEALYQLGSLLRDQGDEGGSCKAWDRFLSRVGDDPSQVAQVNYVKVAQLNMRCR